MLALCPRHPAPCHLTPPEHFLHSLGTNRPLPLSSPSRALGAGAPEPLQCTAPLGALPSRSCTAPSPGVLAGTSSLAPPWFCGQNPGRLRPGCAMASPKCHIPAAGGTCGTLTPLTVPRGAGSAQAPAPAVHTLLEGSSAPWHAGSSSPPTPTSGYSYGAVGTKSHRKAPTLTLASGSSCQPGGPSCPRQKWGAYMAPAVVPRLCRLTLSTTA